MARTYIAAGDVLTLTAPTGGVVAGTAYLIGGMVVIAQETVAKTLPFDGYVTGVHSVTKADSQAWTEGAVIYWDNSAKNFTTTTTSNFRAGIAVEAVASTGGLTTGKVRLNGVGVTAVGGAAP
jgi:predicted RecA/RadA family phage recombinase